MEGYDLIEFNPMYRRLPDSEKKAIGAAGVELMIESLEIGATDGSDLYDGKAEE